MLSNMRILILAVSITGAMTAFALASQDYLLSPLAKYILGIANAGIIALLAGLKSWQDAG